MRGDVTVVRAGRVIDVDAGDVLARQAIVVRDDRIESVEPDDGTAPEGARVIDLSSRTVLPGLIDVHAHLVGREDDGQGYASLVTRSGAQEAVTGVRNARRPLLAGFTPG